MSGPEEVSSKKKPPRFQVVVPGSKKPAARDPRFLSFTGHYNEDLFKKTYSFVDDLRDKEIETLSKKLRSIKDEEEQFKKEKQRKERLHEKQRKMAAARKKEEQQKVEQGKKPFFPKKSVIRQDELTAKFEELKEEKKLDAYMEKKRKKRAARDRARLPKQRREEAE